VERLMVELLGPDETARLLADEDKGS
jgi:hypothetical protein